MAALAVLLTRRQAAQQAQRQTQPEALPSQAVQAERVITRATVAVAGEALAVPMAPVLTVAQPRRVLAEPAGMVITVVAVPVVLEGMGLPGMLVRQAPKAVVAVAVAIMALSAELVRSMAPVAAAGKQTAATGQQAPVRLPILQPSTQHLRAR
jgi:hypothetical protein